MTGPNAGPDVGPIVVVGSGIAGLTACDTLRADGYAGDLVLVGDEPHPPYSRPALSKALLRDPEDLTAHELPEPTHGATELRGVTVTGLDPVRHRVLLDGDDLAYSGLVVATGSRARRLGGPDSGELVLRTLDDALALRSAIADRPSVIVVGAGPLGMEVASGCLGAGCEVTVVADRPPMLPHFGAYLSSMVTDVAVACGLKVVDGLAARVSPGTVVLTDGSTLGADLVVTAAGDVPNLEWLDGSGLLRAGRVEVDTRGRVAERIVAAGDVAAFPTRHGVRRIPLWTSAIEQAKVAARALLHGEEAAELAFEEYFWTEQFGLNLKVSGHLPADGEPELLAGERPEGPAVLRWAHPDGTGTAVAVNQRVPIPRLRRMAAGT